MEANNKVKKCYNSFSCLLSVFIIVFVISAVAYDLFVSKPLLKRDINEIRIEISAINQKIGIANDSVSTFVIMQDTTALTVAN